MKILKFNKKNKVIFYALSLIFFIVIFFVGLLSKSFFLPNANIYLKIIFDSCIFLLYLFYLSRLINTIKAR